MCAPRSISWRGGGHGSNHCGRAGRSIFMKQHGMRPGSPLAQLVSSRYTDGRLEQNEMGTEIKILVAIILDGLRGLWQVGRGDDLHMVIPRSYP